MEDTKTNKDICGYCGKDAPGEIYGTLTIADNKGDTTERITICNECSKKLQAKIALNRFPKDRVKSLDDFLSRSKK